MAGWDWLSRVDLEVYRIGFGSFSLFRLLFVHSDTRCVFHKLRLKEFDLGLWLRLWNKLIYFGFPVMIHKSMVTHELLSSMLQKSSFPSRKRQVKIAHIIHRHSSSCWHYFSIWIESDIKYKRDVASCHFQPDLARKQELLSLLNSYDILWLKSPPQNFSHTVVSCKPARSHF